MNEFSIILIKYSITFNKDKYKPNTVRDWIVSYLPNPTHLYAETLTPNVTIFGDKAFKEVIVLKLNLIGALIKR